MISASESSPSRCCVETRIRSISTGRWRAVLVDLVADRHLRLAVRAEVREHVGLAHLGEPLRDPVRELDRERHQLLGLVRRVAEHHPLVAGADPVERILVAVLGLERVVDALRDVVKRTPSSRQKRARIKIDCYTYELKYIAAGVR